VKNLAAIRDLVEAQKLGYDFTYFKMDFPMDVACISVSGGASVLPFDVTVPLQLQPDPPPKPAELQSIDWLEHARAYLALVVRLQHRLQATKPELQQALQEDFVAARRADPTVTAEDFARWLTCARLHAASVLAMDVDISHYGHVRQLDAVRRERLSSKPDIQL
jgi:hypothetical protein